MTEQRTYIRPGVAAIVRADDGRILLHRRQAQDGWAPPSGGVEAGEDVVSAIHRELKEETKLDVEVQRLVGVYSDPAFQIIRYPDGRSVHFVTCLFLCRPSGGALQGSDEGIQWEWFSPDNLPAGLLPYARVWISDSRVESVIVR